MTDWLRRYATWIWLGVACVLVGSLTVIEANSGTPMPLSLDSSAPGGGLAIRLWLQRSGYTIQRQTDQLRLTDLAPAGHVFFLLAPQREPTGAEIGALRRWARAGGTVVLGTDGAAVNVFSAFGVPIVVAPSAGVHVVQPLLLRPPISDLRGTSFIVGRDSVPGTVAATDFGPVLVHRTVRAGQVWLLTAPHLLDNAHIGRGQNRRLLLNLAGAPSNVLVFGELSASAGSGGGSWWTDTAWGVAILFAVLLALLYRWLAGRRLGPPLIPFRERRRPAVEYVISLAGLLQRAGRREEVLRIYQSELRRRIRDRYGTDDPDILPPPLRAQMEAVLAQPAALDEEGLVRRAADILRCEEELTQHV